MGVFDWFGRGRRQAPPAAVWQVQRVGADIVVEDGRGAVHRLPLAGARTVRIVPLTGGDHHAGATRGGWQVALGHHAGDVLVGPPIADWRSARELARQLCQAASLNLDELTQKLFSRVGQFSAGATGSEQER